MFQGHVVHILVEALIAEAPIAPNPTEGMVQRYNMGLEHWFPGAQASRGQVIPQATP